MSKSGSTKESLKKTNQKELLFEILAELRKSKSDILSQLQKPKANIEKIQPWLNVALYVIAIFGLVYTIGQLILQLTVIKINFKELKTKDFCNRR